MRGKARINTPPLLATVPVHHGVTGDFMRDTLESEITLRDLFAALFTLGMHSSYAAGTLSLPTAADLAYKQADALLAAREKRT